MEGGSFLVAVLGTSGIRKVSERWVGVEDGAFVVSTLRLPLSWIGVDPPRKVESTLDETAGGLLEALIGSEAVGDSWFEEPRGNVVLSLGSEELISWTGLVVVGMDRGLGVVIPYSSVH